jgi:ubiquinone/menaquinone biosynthesis C-methylase UbiE
MIFGLYYRLHRFLSRRDERGEYSSGVWQDKIRSQTLPLCLSGGDRILEVGCGEGLFLGQLAQADPRFKLWGVDNSVERIEQARKRLAGKDARLSAQDATQLSFGNESFDTVVCVNVFFNMPSIEAVNKTLAEMRRVCKTGGTIIFDFRNARNFLLAIKYRLAPFYDKTVKDLPLKTYHARQFQAMLDPIRVKMIQQIAIGFPVKAMAPIILIKAQKL